MAKQKGNILTKNLRGMVGKQVVFKSRQGTDYVAGAPVRHAPFTANERKNQNAFRDRSIYASDLWRDEKYADIYRKAAAALGKKTAFQAAQHDILHPPKIVAVHTAAYKGAPGDNIYIQAIDDVKVMSVLVSITSAEGKTIEHGNAVESDDKLLWIYTAQKENATWQGTKIVITAYDIPYNQAVKELIL